MLTAIPTAFTPLPTGFGLPASNPPYPLAVGSAALGLEGPRLSTAEGRGQAGQLVACSTQITSRSERLPIALCRPMSDHYRVINASSDKPAGLQLLARDSAMVGKRVLGASQPFGMQAQTPHKPLQHNETVDRRSLSKQHREDIYARGLPHSLTFLGRNGAPGSEWSDETHGEVRHCQDRPEIDPAPCRHGRKISRRSEIDLPPIFRGALQKFSCPFATERPGPFEKTGAQFWAAACHE